MGVMEREFSSRAIRRGGLYFYQPQDAIEVIRACRRRGKVILGVDAFEISERFTKPVQEESIDFSAKGIVSGNWDEAEQFVRERQNRGLVFEVVYE